MAAQPRKLLRCFQCQFRWFERYEPDVLVNPSITLDRFGYDEDAAAGVTLTRADGTVIPRGDPEAEDE
jgi:hypothetical protein